jgi:Xaa-Pro aminopeptidase
MAPTDVLPSGLSTSAVQEKLTELRSLLHLHNLDGYLIPSADEHLNEYLPRLKQRRQWISGFTGSAGDFLVGRDQAWLFVDSRYHEQAGQEIDSALIQLSKVGLEEQKTLEETLESLGQSAAQAGKSYRLGFDPFTIAVSQFRAFQKRLQPAGVKLVPLTENLCDRIRSQQPWADTESLPYADSFLFSLPEAITGEPVDKKLARLRKDLQTANADILPLTKLDQIAWLYNLRGWDVPYNPVFIAYAIVTSTQAFLFTNLSRIEPELKGSLQQHTTLLPYTDYAPTLKSLLTPSSRVLIDLKHTTMGTYQLLTDSGSQPICRIVEAANPVEKMKARKNAIEIEQMQQSNLKASRAKTRILKWLHDQIASGVMLTEAAIATKIEQFYTEEDGFQGLSFNTIAGSGANSSIVHYGTPNPEATLKPGDFLLLDSGAQYASGTTDDTRTVAIGEPTLQQIERYTEVLKAHINCAMQKFPKGTTGAQLDGITRSTLWHADLDYGHGTGHGVGAFLNVHEGPNGISKRISQSLEPGMITSIEPGYYEPGWGGIRLENLYVVRELPREQPETAEDKSDSPKTPWYCFESLTYIPFDKQLIDLNRMDSRQRQWLECYYQAILDKLSPRLNPEEVNWLKQVCTF